MSGWTKAKVEHRLVDAIRIISRTTDWPMKLRTRASDVPQYIRTDDDRMDILRAMHERLKLEGYYGPDGLLKRPVPLSWGEGLPPQSSVDLAEQAFWWPAAHVWIDADRLALMTWLGFKARRSQGFPAIVAKRLEKAGYPNVHKRTAYRMKDDALEDIAGALNAAHVAIAGLEDMEDGDRRPLGHALYQRAS